MQEKRPIDYKRNAGGFADIGSLEDGAIITSVVIGDKMLIIKEKSIYEMMMADAVDPERQNAALPTSIQRLVLNQGTKSEIVSRVFLTADILFMKGLLDKSIDEKKAMALAFEALIELDTMNSDIAEFLSIEKDEIQKYEDRRDQKHSYALPSVPYLVTRCKNIVQRADHFTQILMEIITVFYPNSGLKKTSHFTSFLDFAEKKYGEEDELVKYLKKIVPTLVALRNVRDCLDHRLQNITIKDFELQVNGDVTTPTIEMHFRDTYLNRDTLDQFFSFALESLMNIYEGIILHICNRNVNPLRGMPAEIRLIPEVDRRNEFIHYCFWSPIGKGGYFHQ